MMMAPSSALSISVATAGHLRDGTPILRSARSIEDRQPWNTAATASLVLAAARSQRARVMRRPANTGEEKPQHSAPGPTAIAW